jgi:hypothetical protein
VNNGIIANATWTTAGKYGNALVFNGTSALVTINDAASLHLTTAMTLEAWVNPSAISSAWRDVVYKGNDNYYLEATTSSGGVPCGAGTFGTADVGAFGTAVLPLNTWTHIATTYDGATLVFYVNGVQVSTLAQTGAMVTSSNPLQIGGDSIYGQYFQGTIDEVRVYARALSAAEIQSDMNLAIISNQNTVPTISPIADQVINEDTSSGAIALTVGDAESAAGSLTLSAGSSNPALVLTNNIVFGGGGGDRTVTISPASAQTGVATITVTVSDGTNSASAAFVLTVQTTPGLADGTCFGCALAGGGTVVRSFTIENIGGGVLTLDGTPNVAVSGPNAADFTVTLQPTSPVSSGDLPGDLRPRRHRPALRHRQHPQR